MTSIPEMLDQHAAEHRAKAAEEGRKATEARPHVEQAASILTARREHIEELEAQLAEIEAQLAEARAGHAEATERHAAALAVVAAHEAEAQAAADVAEEVAALAEARRQLAKPVPPQVALAATGLMPREELKPVEKEAVPAWNDAHPIGTPVLYWPGQRTGEGIESVTRSHAWALGDGTAVVAVEGHAGGIALTHVQPLDEADAPDDLTAPGVADSRAQVAPHLPPPVPHGPAGPDAGTLAAIENGHPLTTRTDHAPSPRGQHAAPPRASRVTGALRKVGLIHDEQDGDANE